MKKSNEEIDELIYEALSEDEVKFYEDLGEQSLIEMATDVFKGRNRWAAFMVMALTFVFFGLFVYCVVQFINAVEVREMLLWMGGGFWSMTLVMSLKLWHWMQMDKNTLLREVKKLQLQISVLSSHISSGSNEKRVP